MYRLIFLRAAQADGRLYDAGEYMRTGKGRVRKLSYASASALACSLYGAQWRTVLTIELI